MTTKAKKELILKEMHNKLLLGLCDLTDKYQELGVVHMIYIGIDFYTKMAVDSAPSEKEGKEIVNEIIDLVRKDAD
tara:strand:- start:34 stop:261 length:228 start_codon:yes stop_codon:yes gene_type:complete